MCDSILSRPNSFTFNGLDSLNGVDSDLHPQSNYYSCDEFNGFIDAKDKVSQNFSCIHFNCRSLVKNFDIFSLFLNDIHHNFTIIGLTETWFKPEDSLSLYNIDNYDLIVNNRSQRIGGGVGMFIQTDLKYNQRNDFTFMSDSFESLFLEFPEFDNVLCTCTSRYCVVGVVYRPPASSIEDFLQKLTGILEKISREHKSCFLLGDFNIDLASVTNRSITDQFLDTLYSFSVLPLIQAPTRISRHKASLLDNILTNADAGCESGILLSDLSDHLPVFTFTNVLLKLSENIDLPVNKRVFNDANFLKFSQSLSELDWHDCIQIEDSNVNYNSFISVFMALYNECFPFTTIRKKKNLKKTMVYYLPKKNFPIKDSGFIENI